MDEMKRFSYAHHAAEQQQAEITEHRHELVKKLLAKLPERERTVVTLHYLGEMTVKEIGRCLGVSVNTIASRLRRAQKRLRDDQKQLIHEVLGSVQLPPSLSENIMQQITELKPTPPPIQF